MPTDTQEMPVLETLAAMTAASLERCDLPADVLLLVRLAARRGRRTAGVVSPSHWCRG